MLIFLDFDGVLHPYPCKKNDYFCQISLFTSFFKRAEFTDIHFVISSSWRQHHTFKKLRSFFPPDFQTRIIGTTPIFPYRNGIRGQEINIWRNDFQRQNEPWLALDDLIDLFDDSSHSHVFLCNSRTGLIEHDLPQLTQRIQTLRDLYKNIPLTKPNT